MGNRRERKTGTEKEERISFSNMATVKRTEGQDGVMRVQGHSAITSFQPYVPCNLFYSATYGTVLIEFLIIIDRSCVPLFPHLRDRNNMCPTYITAFLDGSITKS